MEYKGSTLSNFHPIISKWFTEQIGKPTQVQEESWQRISNGEHVLITAPTGSGKTFAAFLWAINQLVTRQLPSGHTSILYISPLKALANDIHRNLLYPLDKLRIYFRRDGERFPDIKTGLRTGDTPQSERQQMQRHPPEILITTPESLNLLLSSLGGRSILRNINTVILDEIHAVVGNKRGVHLMTAVERLVALSADFQRIGLSATVKPMEVVAEFIGGFKSDGNLLETNFTPRTVSMIRSGNTKQYDIRVRFPLPPDHSGNESTWEPLVDEFKKIINRNHSTLLFANSRRLCEKIAAKINEGEKSPIIYVHHGSLSREIRQEVERRLREGELRAVIATNTLELGIDIGSLDEVVLVQSPSSISSAIQRVGRAGHQVGEVCRGVIFPTHSQDLLEAAVLAPTITNQDMEAIIPIECPLDVLAQIIISMVGVEKWDIEALYTQLKASYPYRHLTWQQFDLVLNMLAGRYADSRVRELKPRISIDRLDNTVVARKGAIRAVYTSGGTIPDRGYFHLRHQGSNALIGDLDEEFVWEATLGQTFTLGIQNWRIEKITHNDVFVVPGNPNIKAMPFWKGEENYRDFHFSERIGHFLEGINNSLDNPDLIESLQQNNYLDETAANRLLTFLKHQREITGCDLPHRHHLLLELINSGPSGVPGNQLMLHTFWGGRINRPFAMALDAAWEAKYGYRPEFYVGNDCIAFQLPHDIDGAEILSLVSSATLDSLLKQRLESSGFFGARFRECAGRSLLLVRNKFGERTPLWLNRLRSQKLLSSVLHYEDFPITLEAWRTCLRDELDLDNLRKLLTELESGVIRWSITQTNYPSPLAQNLSWRQTNEYMYQGDEPRVGTTSKVRDDLLSQVVFAPEIRPQISSLIIEQFEQKRQRLFPGYAPESLRNLVDWVKERWLIPATEWERLLKAIHTDHKLNTTQLLESVADKLVRIKPPQSSEALILSLELLPKIILGLYKDVEVTIQPITPDVELPPSYREDFNISEYDPDELLTSILGEWLQFYGPVNLDFITSALGIPKQSLLVAIEDLIDTQKIIIGKLAVEDSQETICDSENFEILLRLNRTAAKPAFKPLDTEMLPLFLAHYQGLLEPKGDIDHLFRCIEQLLCLPAPAESWESEYIPVRVKSYSPSHLDRLINEGGLRWVGKGKQQVFFAFDQDLKLVQADQFKEQSLEAPVNKWFPNPFGHYDFSTLLELSDYSPEQLTDHLWEAVWRGEVSNDTFAALRRGIETQFKFTKATSSKTGLQGRRHRAGQRISFSRWQASLPSIGKWFLLPINVNSEDLIEIEERVKDRVRVLLDRYGILFRELLKKELPSFQWGNIFRALSLMELSGEVLTGYFFRDISGPQFISHHAFRILQQKIPNDRVYWLNATDPASLCGAQLESLKRVLPKRVNGTHLVYHGTHLVVISQRNGHILTFNVTPEDPDLPQYFGFLDHLLNRKSRPLRRIIIDTINSEEAIQSPYLDSFRTTFDVLVDYRNVTLYRRSS